MHRQLNGKTISHVHSFCAVDSQFLQYVYQSDAGLCVGVLEAVGRVSRAASAYLSRRSQKGAVPDVLIQITMTQGLVMGRWCGLGLLAVLNTL